MFSNSSKLKNLWNILKFWDWNIRVTPISNYGVATPNFPGTPMSLGYVCDDERLPGFGLSRWCKVHLKAEFLLPAVCLAATRYWGQILSVVTILVFMLGVSQFITVWRNYFNFRLTIFQVNKTQSQIKQCAARMKQTYLKWPQSNILNEVHNYSIIHAFNLNCYQLF